jgi:hypothetical protein
MALGSDDDRGGFVSRGGVRQRSDGVTAVQLGRELRVQQRLARVEQHLVEHRRSQLVTRGGARNRRGVQRPLGVDEHESPPVPDVMGRPGGGQTRAGAAVVADDQAARRAHAPTPRPTRSR